jgi:hypothetical protein
MPGPVYSQEYVLRKFFGLRPVIDNLVNEIDNSLVIFVKNLLKRGFFSLLKGHHQSRIGIVGTLGSASH